MPNFFLVGAPKCGTTAMYSYLRGHPEVFLPEQKELNFFATDLYPSRYITERQYHAIFEAAGDRPVCGESSVWYLYSEVAAASIRAFNPEARILIMLRNPIDMLQSLHSQFVFDNMENIPDFAAALEAEEDRRQGGRVPPTVYSRRLLYYSEVARFATQVERYFSTFGKDRVMVVLHDDLAASPDSICAEVLCFLGVSDRGAPALRMVNVNKRSRSRALQCIANPPHAAKTIGRRFLPFVVRRRLLEWVISKNALPCGRQPVSAQVRARLASGFRADVDRLGEFLGRDLRHWVDV